MKLSDAIRDQIDSNIRAKGKMYADWNMAKIISCSDDEIIAEVREDNRYHLEVTIHIEPKKIAMHCTCSMFQTEGVCKHSWAVILTAEKNGFESKIVTTDTVIANSRISNIDQIFGNECKNKPLDKLKDYFEQNNLSPKQESKNQNVYQFTKLGSSFQKPPPDWKNLFVISNEFDVYNLRKTENNEIADIYYHIDGSSKVGLNDLKIDFLTINFSPSGKPGKEIRFEVNSSKIDHLRNPLDRQIFSIILGSNSKSYYSYSYTRLTATLAEFVLPLVLQTRRCKLISKDNDTQLLLHYDESRKWELALSLENINDGYQIKPFFKFETETRDLKDAVHINNAGYVFWKNGSVNKLNAHHLCSWIQNFINETYVIPLNEAKHFVLNFKALKDKPPFTYPEDLETKEECLEPIPVLWIFGIESWRETNVFAELNFNYDCHTLKYKDTDKFLYDSDKDKLYRINHEFHNKCLQLLLELGVKKDIWEPDSGLINFSKNSFNKIASTLITKGWIVKGEDIQFKKPGNFSFSVRSGIDWFELQGTCEYDGELINIPDMLDAIKKNKDCIELDNGVMGILPTEWLEKYSRVISMGTTENKSIRFKKSQTLLIDLLLAEQPNVKCDDFFTLIRDSLNKFTGIIPEKESGNFCGVLRNYQQEGLGWLSFLNQFGFGGCLADDMGLGKTIQVLAMLEKQRITSSQTTTGRKNKKTKIVKQPSLVVAPRSLVYNWLNEASRFTPDLKVLDFSSSQRTDDKFNFEDFNVIIVTYGTLRRDIKTLSKTSFNYIILDEAQVIKNSTTATAKAVHLLNGSNRLALSGTPVENHLSDLWSIFEFLNPGILGSASVFKEVTKSDLPDENECELLRKALRPFILRRTKLQVAKDLPPKTEELITCEMGTEQKKQYNELKQYYQKSLKEKISQSGLNNSKIHILEALLRLRQSACHPGLIDKKLINSESVKLETLVEHLLELKEEGHKSLVFSQFTSMLAIISDKLKESGIKYEYLDGKSRKRQEIIERFENDPDCTVFLISLKAGGVGLNLTSADYVFIFDPWWNPAAEMQAIDRTHRIGQTKPVFAYRLICKNSVEEKIIELQKAKRFLAESVISTDESILSSITSEELELLLG